MDRKKDPTKLYGAREFAMIGGAVIVGIGLFLGVRFRQTGEISAVDVISCVGTAAISVVLIAMVAHKANRKE